VAVTVVKRIKQEKKIFLFFFIPIVSFNENNTGLNSPLVGKVTAYFGHMSTAL